MEALLCFSGTLHFGPGGWVSSVLNYALLSAMALLNQDKAMNLSELKIVNFQTFDMVTYKLHYKKVNCEIERYLNANMN